MSSKPVKKEDSTVLTEILNLKDVEENSTDLANDPQNQQIQNKFDSALNDLMPQDENEEIDFLASASEDSGAGHESMTSTKESNPSPGFSLDIEAPILEFEATGQIESGSLDLSAESGQSSDDSAPDAAGIEMDFTDSSLDLGLGDLQNEHAETNQTGDQSIGLTDLDLGEDSSPSFNAGTSSSADLLSSEEAKNNIEKTIADIVAPKSGDTGEFSLDNFMEEESSDEATKMAAMPIPKAESKKESTDSFDLDFNNPIERTDPKVKNAGPFDDELLINQAVSSEISDKTGTGFHFEAESKSEKVVTATPDKRKMSHDEDFANRREINDDEYVRLQATIRQLREEREDLLDNIKNLKNDLREFEQDNLTLKAVLDETKIEVSILRKRHLSELEDYKYRLSMSEEKRAFSEEKLRNLEKMKEKLEQKARIDIGQIRQREKELESKLELLTMDVDSQVHSRDQKILELRRKIDSLEFNMENATIREQKSNEDKKKLEDKLNKMMKTLRNSIKNLEDDIEENVEMSVRPEKKNE